MGNGEELWSLLPLTSQWETSPQCSECGFDLETEEFMSGKGLHSTVTSLPSVAVVYHSCGTCRESIPGLHR